MYLLVAKGQRRASDTDDISRKDAVYGGLGLVLDLEITIRTLTNLVVRLAFPFGLGVVLHSYDGSNP